MREYEKRINFSQMRLVIKPEDSAERRTEKLSGSIKSSSSTSLCAAAPF
jgi:hypothetical protein